MNVGSYSKVYNLEVYLGNSQTCMMGLFAKLVIDQNPFTISKPVYFSQGIEILDSCPTGSVLPHGEKMSL